MEVGHPVLSVVERANIRFVYNNVTLMQIKVHQKDVAGKRVQVCKMTLMAMVVANNSVVIMGWMAAAKLISNDVISDQPIIISL